VVAIEWLTMRREVALAGCALSIPHHIIAKPQNSLKRRVLQSPCVCNFAAAVCNNWVAGQPRLDEPIRSRSPAQRCNVGRCLGSRLMPPSQGQPLAPARPIRRDKRQSLPLHPALRQRIGGFGIGHSDKALFSG
jgi:hypothetical protein